MLNRDGAKAAQISSATTSISVVEKAKVMGKLDFSLLKYDGSKGEALETFLKNISLFKRLDKL